MIRTLLFHLLTPVLIIVPLACRPATPAPATRPAHPDDDHDHEHDHDDDHDHDEKRIDVPDIVRRNLGITFARVESRPVAAVIRVPGHFELTADGRREYRTMLAGRVEILVRQFDRVEPGTPLYRLRSPHWRELQEKLSDAESTIRQTEARVASIPLLIQAHRRHEQILEKSIALWEQRVRDLEQNQELGAVSGNELTAAQSTLAAQQAELAEILEKEADLQGQITAAQAEHDAAHARFRLLIATAAMLTDIDAKQLAAPYDLDAHLHSGLHRHDEPHDRPPAAWRLIDEVEVRASSAGIVHAVELADGAWASEGSLVIAAIDPARLRFRAVALQSDLGRLLDAVAGPLKTGDRAPTRGGPRPGPWGTAVRTEGHQDPAMEGPRPGPWGSGVIVPPKGVAIDLRDVIPAAVTVGLAADPRERSIELIALPERLRPWTRPGVAAHLEVIAAGGQAELAIPLACVVQDGLERFFFRRDPANPDILIRVEADLGIDDGRWVVVRDGVNEGDEVVLDGAYQLMIATSGSAQKGGHFHPDGTYHAEEDH